MSFFKLSFYSLACLCITCGWHIACAEPWISPGDLQLRNDLQLLNDSGVMNIPLTSWPVAVGDIDAGIDVDAELTLTPSLAAALARVRSRARFEMLDDAPLVEFSISGSNNPRIIRSFENTPRADAEASAGISWLGDRFALKLNATYAENPVDGDEIRPDGTYVGAALGNWMLSAGWQERWWGPGRDGSLILSNNARPFPSIGIQRNVSIAARSKWFRWMGPWTLTSFMGLLDDERVVDNGLIWGFRTSFRPVRGLEIGLSRAAQWCGDGRECDIKTFLRLLNGNDNQGANVDPEDEPGNQIGGIDARWSLPGQIPLAFYMQWIAEDTRRTGAQLHQWMEQVGIEYWGQFGDFSHRTHLELVSTSARLGALGEGSQVPNSAYNHSIFRTGYRYNGRSIGHGMDGDGLSWSIGSTLVDSNGNVWNFSLRHIDINRIGVPDPRHTLSPTPQEFLDVQVSYRRQIRYGQVYLGLGYQRLDDELQQTDTNDVTAFFRWSNL